MRRTIVLFGLLIGSLLCTTPVSAEFVKSSDKSYIPIPIILVHGMNSAPLTWKATAEKWQPLIQGGSIDLPTNFRYSLPADVSQLEPFNVEPEKPNASYIQTAHYGDHGVLEDIFLDPDNEDSGFITDPSLALEAVSVRVDNDGIRSLLEAINAALELQDTMGISPENRKVILVGHSTGGLVIRKFLQKKGSTILAEHGGQTYKEIVHRILYLDVPHEGSPLANYIRYIRRFNDKYAVGPSDSELHFFIGNSAIDQSNLAPEIVDNLISLFDDSRPEKKWNDAAIVIIEDKIGVIDGPIFELLSVPVRTTFQETVVARLPFQVTGTPRVEWKIVEEFSDTYPLEKLPESSADISINIVGQSGTAGSLGVDAPEILGEGLVRGVSGGEFPADNLSTILADALATAFFTFPATADRNIDVFQQSGVFGFPEGNGLLEVIEGDGLVTVLSQTGNKSAKDSVVVIGSAHIDLAFAVTIGATENWEQILTSIFDSPASVQIQTSQYIDPQDQTLRAYAVFSLDDFFVADATLGPQGPVVFDNITTETFITASLNAPNFPNVWPAGIYGRSMRIQSIGDTFNSSIKSLPKIRPLNDLAKPLPLGPEFWPYGASGDSFVKRRVIALKAPDGDTVILGPGQIAIEMAFLADDAERKGEFDLDFSGHTRNVIPDREATYSFERVGVPAYVQNLNVSSKGGEDVLGVRLKRNSAQGQTDTWTRELTEDSFAPAMTGAVDIEVTINRPVPSSDNQTKGVFAELLGAENSPFLSLDTENSDDDESIFFGTFSKQEVSEIPVGIYPIAISIDGIMQPEKGDGDPRSIAWYDAPSDTFRDHETTEDTLHKIFIGPAFVREVLASQDDGEAFYNATWVLQSVDTSTFNLQDDELGPGETILIEFDLTGIIKEPELSDIKLKKSSGGTPSNAISVIFDTTTGRVCAVFYIPSAQDNSGSYVVLFSGKHKSGDEIDRDPSTRVYAVLDTEGTADKIIGWDTAGPDTNHIV